MKRFLIILGCFITTLYGVLSWDIVTHSQAPDPRDSKYATQCGAPTTNTRVEETTYDQCCIDYHEAMDAVEKDWQNNLQQLIDQEMPASEMVDYAYENLRTYNCWLEYICRAVEYSGRAPIQSANGGLGKVHLGTVPGCQDPEDMHLESEWSSFINQLKEVPIANIPVRLADNLVDDLFGDTKINYFPSCMTPEQQNNKSPNIRWVQKNYKECKEALELKFGCPDPEDGSDTDYNECLGQSNAMMILESSLKKANGDQKARALESKLGSIVPKLQTMEVHVGYFSNFLQQLDTRFKCYAKKCS